MYQMSDCSLLTKSVCVRVLVLEARWRTGHVSRIATKAKIDEWCGRRGAAIVGFTEPRLLL